MKMILLRDTVAAGAVLALCRYYNESHLLAESTADKSANAVRLPTGCLHDLGQRGAPRLLEQIENLSRLATLARRTGLLDFTGPFARLALLRRDRRSLRRGIGRQALDSRPNAGHCDLAVSELLHRFLAWQGIPDFHQSAGGPLLSQLAQLYGAVELLGFRVARGFLSRSVPGDVVVSVNRKYGHRFQAPCRGTYRVDDIHHSGRRNKQVNSAANFNIGDLVMEYGRLSLALTR